MGVNMNRYLKEFLKRGLIFGGFGPIIAGIIYIIIDKTGVDFSLSGTEVFIAILSTYLLSFVHAGASVFNQIEHWTVPKSMLFHFIALYISYTLCYLINSWIEFKLSVLGIFTGIFVAIYFVVWAVVVITLKITSGKLNRKLL